MAKSFAQNLRYFQANFFLRTFALFLFMKRNEFCAIFLRNLRKTGNIFLRKLRMKRNFSFAQFAQNHIFFAEFFAKPQVLRKM